MNDNREGSRLRQRLNPLLTSLGGFSHNSNTPVSSVSYSSNSYNASTPASAIQPYNPQQWIPSPMPGPHPERSQQLGSPDSNGIQSFSFCRPMCHSQLCQLIHRYKALPFLLHHTLLHGVKDQPVCMSTAAHTLPTCHWPEPLCRLCTGPRLSPQTIRRFLHLPMPEAHRANGDSAFHLWEEGGIPNQ